MIFPCQSGIELHAQEATGLLVGNGGIVDDKWGFKIGNSAMSKKYGNSFFGINYESPFVAPRRNNVEMRLKGFV
jgi:hypothetical protein